MLGTELRSAFHLNPSLQHLLLDINGEAALSTSNSGGKKGGWITFPFITATMLGLTLAAAGWMNNLIVYMIEEFHVNSVDAAQIANVVFGCTMMFPVVGAAVADSSLGCFSVISISSLVSLLGMIILVLTSTSDAWRPPPCQTGSTQCISPSKSQLAILFTAVTLATIGVGGTRFTIGTMGALQFDNAEHHRRFFDWFTFTWYASGAIGATAIVYVEDNVSWGWGYGLCAAANILGLAIFLLGSRFYRRGKPQKSPFIGLARVVVAAIRKRNMTLSLKDEDYYKKLSGNPNIEAQTPTKAFKFLNHAALIAEGDTLPDSSVAKPRRLCTVQQVEDLKTLIRIVPIWSTSIFLGTPLAIQSSLITLQALSMDRRVGHHFKVPAGSMLVFIMVTTCVFLPLIDRYFIPTWKLLTGKSPTPLQRVGIGHVLCTLSMALSALVELKRLKIAHSHHLQDQYGSIVPMSVMWLVPQLALAGVGEAFHFPGNAVFYYQEFPASLKSTSTAVVAMFFGIAFYLSTAVIGLVRRTTEWLPGDINKGRMDNVYWILFVIGVVNFGFYLVCAWLYKYKGVEKTDENNDSTPKSRI
ncbi:Nitrate-transporting ATPase [Bertholletia excelsa]